ncbi:MAG TPA: AtpZ/AtpI family protein [Polyangiaceae bacterium]|jgi:ATP synthase protein I|nr:AtpZ/AtpI family protein [Polyangiaceae bacterium]
MKQRLEVYRGLGGFGTLGLEIILSILLPMGVGWWLDGRFATAPWIMWAGFFLGIATAIRALLRALRIMRKEAAREEKEHGNPKPLFLSEEERRAEREEQRKQAEVHVDDDSGEPRGGEAK